MNKSELVNVVRDRADLTIKEANLVVNTVLDVLGETLRSEDVIIAGFGKFVSKVRPARTVRNPMNGEMISVPDRRFVSFKAGKSLKETVNS